MTLNLLERLANALERIDELDEAKVIYENLLAGRVRLLGTDHPDTVRTRGLLVSIDPDLEVGGRNCRSSTPIEGDKALSSVTTSMRAIAPSASASNRGS